MRVLTSGIGLESSCEGSGTAASAGSTAGQEAYKKALEQGLSDEAAAEAKRQAIDNNWQVASENARTQGQALPNQPDYPTFPPEQEIITKAQALNGFVSQVSPEPTPVKVTKKS